VVTVDIAVVALVPAGVVRVVRLPVGIEASMVWRGRDSVRVGSSDLD